MNATFPSRCPCGEAIQEGDEIRRNEDDTAWCCALCGYTGVRKAKVDMPPKGNRGTIMQTIAARKARQAKRGR